MAEKIKVKTKAEVEREFINSFMKQITSAKAKTKVSDNKIIKKKILRKKLKPSIMKKRDEEMLEKLRALTIEHEKSEKVDKIEKPKIVEATTKPTSFGIRAPIYKRPLPLLPKPPKSVKEWPIPEPRSVARPPEEEAAAPPIEELQAPAPPVPAFQETSPASPSMVIIDLGKLDPFISDKDVSIIQCDGASLPVNITKQGRIEKTDIKLSEEEIKIIIQKFADRAEQELTEPIFKTQISNLAITAIISSFTGYKFVISKS